MIRRVGDAQGLSFAGATANTVGDKQINLDTEDTSLHFVRTFPFILNQIDRRTSSCNLRRP